MARIWRLFRNPLIFDLLYQGAPATGLGAINRWKLELQGTGSAPYVIDSNLNPGVFDLDATQAQLTVDFSKLTTPPDPGHYLLRLYSYDLFDPAPLMWTGGEILLEIRN